MTTPRVLRLDPSDNVVIAIDEISAGVAPMGGVSARDRIPKGHKMAVAAVEAGAPIRKFGQIIGFASRPVSAGEWVHEHNCGVKEFARDYHFGEDARPETIAPIELSRSFRASGGQTERSGRATMSQS